SINESQYEELIIRRIDEIIGVFTDNKIKAAKNIKGTQERQKKTYDRKIRAITYKIGDLMDGTVLHPPMSGQWVIHIKEYERGLPESLRRKIRQIRDELMALAGDVQLVVDNTGAYAILGDSVMNLMESVSDDTLLPYVMDVMTASEERYDLTKDMSDSDISGLLSVAINPTNSSGQRVNAYRRLGNYIYAVQMERTTTQIEQELRTYSRQNGSRIRTIALRAKGLSQEAEMLQPKDLHSVTPDWLYRLPRQDYERLVQMCGKVNSRMIQNYLNNDVGSQELPFEGGNVCGNSEGSVRWYEDRCVENVWRENNEVQMIEMMELHNDGNDGVRMMGMM
ncbi:4847_t:CDS:2, partial [Dentiscutata erythropus]